MAKLTGKIAVVTGASKGIGAGIAKRLGAEGATVVVNFSSDQQGADTTVKAITGAGGSAVALRGSVAKRADVEALFAEIAKQFQKVDILVNNAGVYGFAPLEGFTEEAFDQQFGVNVKGLLLATQAAAALMPAEGGSIINIGSVASDLTPPMSAIYSGTKGAVDSITRVLAKELGARRIRVNSINPGFVTTEGTSAAGITGSDFAAQMIAATPLGRAGEPSDIADVAAFLASDDARWVTGSLLQVAGGQR